MKKTLLILFAFLLTMLCACGRSSPQSASEPSRPVPDASVSSPVSMPAGPEQDALLELLERQIYLYEMGNYGLPFNRGGGRYVDWGFAGIFAEEAGVPYGREGGRQELLRLMYDRWVGVAVDDEYYFSEVRPSYCTLDLKLQEAEISEDEARIVTSRVRNGVELFDSEYRFRREKADAQLLAGEAAALTLDGYYWRYESVRPLEEKIEYETVVITTPEQLWELNTRVNAREPAAVNGSFTLGADIDMTGYEWQPMGGELPDEWLESAYLFAKVRGGFNGAFDGAGHTISGITVQDNRIEAETGFFGRIGPNARVHDLTVVGDISDGGWQETHNASIGGFAGRICGGAEVTDCRFVGTVDGYCYVGGFVGSVQDDFEGWDEFARDAVVADCSAEVNMAASVYGGGFAGSIRGDVSGCTATGTLTIMPKGCALPYSIGGFVGDLRSGLRDCKGAVQVLYDVEGANRMGNFIGTMGVKSGVENCVVHPDFLHDGWYLIGFQGYRDSDFDIRREAWNE